MHACTPKIKYNYIQSPKGVGRSTETKSREGWVKMSWKNLEDAASAIVLQIDLVFRNKSFKRHQEIKNEKDVTFQCNGS